MKLHTNQGAKGKPAEDAAREEQEAPPAETPAEAPAPADESSEQDKVADEIAALNAQIMRLRADFDNLRRRTRREQGEQKDRAQADAMEALLPVMDNFELGLAAAMADVDVKESIRQGFQIVYDQLRGIIEKAGVTPIESEGLPFDPQVHESIAHLPSDQYAEGIVSAQTRRGYRLGERVLRPAQVVVSSGPGKSS
jgi:molecular chaperone GrpE